MYCPRCGAKLMPANGPHCVGCGWASAEFKASFTPEEIEEADGGRGDFTAWAASGDDPA